MLKNYLKIAVRTMLKSKGYTALNIMGLAAGMACCALILLYVQYELSYDRHNEHAESIYRIVLDGKASSGKVEGAASPAALAPHIKEAMPKVEAAARFFKLVKFENLVEWGEHKFYEKRFYWGDAEAFEVFSLPLLKGDSATALSAPNTAVITQAMARKYFGAEEPLGQVLRVDGKEDYTVTGVLEDLPGNMHFTFDFLASLSTMGIDEQEHMAYWTSVTYYTYLRLREGTAPEKVEETLHAINYENIGKMLEMIGVEFNYYLQPLTDIHLHSKLSGELEPNGDITYVYVFSCIAVFVMLIACINFMNLATARSEGRAREVGVRKVAGAEKRQLVAQFLGAGSALGKRIGMQLPPPNQLSFFNAIVGVMENFHFDSLHSAVEPMVLQLSPNALTPMSSLSGFQCLTVRLGPGAIDETLAYLAARWQAHTDSPLDYYFLDQSLDQLYRAEMKLGTVLQVFSALAIFIACLGLFGLASFAAERRTKEVGIRKALGASARSLVGLLSTQFVRLVLLANLAAWPLSYWVMDRWLQGFYYRIDLELWVFAAGGLAALAIALVTVGGQAIRVALKNPVEALRYE